MKNLARYNRRAKHKRALRVHPTQNWQLDETRLVTKMGFLSIGHARTSYKTALSADEHRRTGVTEKE